MSSAKTTSDLLEVPDFCHLKTTQRMKSISPVHFIDKLVKKNTVEEDLRDLNDQNDVAEGLADPYRLHRSITTLQAAGIPIREFSQTQANCTLVG